MSWSKKCLSGLLRGCLLPRGFILLVLALSLMGAQAALAANNWTTTGSLNTPRKYHTITPLPNGKILVAGGDHSDTALTSAQLYDQGTGAWVATGALKTGRESHTATRLASGAVLVAGGNDTSFAPLKSAELYTAGAWVKTTGDLATARAYHTATLLPNDKVLVVGGGISNTMPFQSLASAELFDPAGSWTTTASLSDSRYDHTATLLPNGKVLVAGGGYFDSYGITHFRKSAELFTPTPASGSWASATDLNTARMNHTATLLRNGQVLVVGGSNDTGYLVSTEIYDPDHNTWTPVGDLKTGRELHTATLLSNGKVLVAGGSGDSGFLPSAEIYDPVAQTWTDTGSLTTARDWHTAILLPNGKVLVAGGLGESGDLASAELYNSGRASPGGLELLLLD